MARHSDPQTDVDYHNQYEKGAFIESLKETRLRQARRIIDAVRALDPKLNRVLDFGAGRGWFLDACRVCGIPEVAGADTSVLATELLRKRGISSIALVPPQTWPWVPSLKAPFAPGLLTFLDVVEHFEPEGVIGSVRGIVASLRPDLRLVAIKVPVSRGLLYRIADLLARFGKPAALEQLYQVGTFPPHRSYFSRKSLHELFRRSGLRVLWEIRDRDFEPESLASRARALAAFPSPLVRLAARAASALISALRLEDSIVLIGCPIE